MLRNPTVIETISLNKLCCFVYLQRVEENRISKRILGTKRLRGKPRNRWEDEVREVGNLVGEKGWKERVYNREEWKKLRRVARNSRILHMPMNDSGDPVAFVMTL